MGFLSKLFRTMRKNKKRKMLEEERRRREIERQQQQRHREETRQARDYVKFLNDNEESLTKNCFALDEKRSRLEKQLSDLQSKYALSKEVVELEQRKSRAEKELNVTQRKLETIQKNFRSIQYASEVFNNYQYAGEKLLLEGFDPDVFKPIAQEDLKCMQIKDLRSLYRANQKEIEKLVESYKDRYTTKTIAAIYQLMVLALEAEMQNVLHILHFGSLDKAIEEVKSLTARYYTIATSGNQTIASTLTKFIGQIEYYYLEAVKIEYEYYVKQERAKEEQRALKEQMRQEAEERRLLEQQKKQVEAEESKYEKELLRITEKMKAVSGAEIEKLRIQLQKVQSQLDAVKDKKDEIIHLQNGKAGTVYVISNIGSFGDDVFKIGMTRRLEPMDRIRELGDASVPFPFDVHSFIFSEDAVALETKLHRMLNNKRINKINLRKEFFRISLDELQALVEDCDPSAAFNRTALAEQFRQSLSIDEVPNSIDLEDLEEETCE